MTFNDAAIDSILNSIVSYALESGRFDSVNEHEPKNVPPTEVAFAVWVQNVKSIRGSGQASTSGCLTLNGRIYMNFRSQPFDYIDPKITAAAADLMGLFNGNFQFGGIADIRNVDILGTYGTPLSATAGYVEIDRTVFRVMTIVLSIVINDMWIQSS